MLSRRFSETPFRQRSVEGLMLAVLLLLASTWLAQASSAVHASTDVSSVDRLETAMSTSTTAFPKDQGVSDYAQVMRNLMSRVFANMPTSLRRKLLEADVRPECTAGLLRTLRGFQNLEPWALKLFDATGKYPTGLFEGTRADIGAFDECLRTVVRDGYGNMLSRGQYCNLMIYVTNGSAVEEVVRSFSDVLHPRLQYFKNYFTFTKLPLGRLAVCSLDDCNQQDMQALVATVTPPFMHLEVSDCVTGEPEPWSRSAIGIWAFLGVLLITVAACTYVDCFMDREPKGKKNRSALFEFVTAFSATSNTRMLLKVADKNKPDHYALQFLHGMRFYGIVHIALGHCGSVMSDSWSGLLNLFLLSDRWSFMIITAGFSSVDTFFFLSGFFLCLTVTRQKRNGPIVFIIGVTRRLIRTCIPLFFIIMCLYALHPFVTGPNTKAFFQDLHNEVASHWWYLVLQIRNFDTISERDVIPHTWYLSTDFQLFVVSLVTLLIFKRRRTLTVGAFALLSLLGCIAGTCVVAVFQLSPFMIFPGSNADVMLRTLDDYYIRPYYHAVCYFGGCMTYLVIDDFKERKISKRWQQAGWYGSVACCLFCVFVKFAWYRSPDPVSTGVTLLAAFLDRILWTLFLAWITLACSTGRGGALSKLLSWNAYVPLSKLSFGVYLIHVPFLHLMFHASRERRFWSVFNQLTLLFLLLVWSFLLSYLSFLVCEAPTAALDKLLFSRIIGGGGRRGGENSRKTQPENNQGGSDVKAPENAEDNVFSRC
ncbi:nose resistant to fluoxetine protein 6 isoform X3 [Dermacentor silvarum]|uniref:nose resistant to fluoxetine protein 6 isoform X3 n=1 Tax=Dermacentor silvarum TaxID=543639 RepID=UPI002100C191|nr:nose resistant to fluoxetine protein 6 isoform X3 [Dermacentor silvarum]XP_049519674.1 nose resistant to fluoxetine protein 6 isoform X3 [Dermacentor silvarum]